MALDERDALKQANPTIEWARKVDRMTNDQVSDALLKLISQANHWKEAA